MLLDNLDNQSQSVTTSYSSLAIQSHPTVAIVLLLFLTATQLDANQVAMIMYNRQVTFSDTSEMVLVTKLSDGPDRDMLWYNQNELDDFKANMASYIRMIRLCISRHNVPSASSVIGLEKYLTVQLTEEYKLKRRKLHKDVLGHARLQREIPHADVERLARISADSSKWARERARAAGLFLERDQERERQREKSESNGPAPSSLRQKRRSSLQEAKRSRIAEQVSSESILPTQWVNNSPRSTRIVISPTKRQVSHR